MIASEQFQESIGIMPESSFVFSDVTNIWKLSKEAWANISYEASKRHQNRVLKSECPELLHGHLYSINQEVYVFWNGYLILVLDRFLREAI
jgi:hypothetical protein